MSAQNLSPEEKLSQVAELLMPYQVDVVYPETDGEPMAETDTHRDLMADALIYPLKEHFRDQPDVYVSGNLLLYYEEGNPRASVAPDVFVVFGIAKGERHIYKLWEEEKAPDVVIELTSASTRQKDLGDKRLLYEELGIREYFIFDPLHEYLEPPLRGFRLEEGFYAPIKGHRKAVDSWEMDSQVLGLILRSIGQQLRLHDPETDRLLPTLGEVTAAYHQAEEARRQEAEARRLAEVRLAKLEAELARLREK
jgi:Uma2 family endonuclease